ncbi:chromosomal replication initiator protein DnaA [Candidatus Shapirobacteria bacterium]|nr:chromosomal replication initiator protein DnaA [Candidatus Shapirobacteria bacterium]
MTSKLNLTSIWNNALQEIKLQVGQAVFQTIFTPTKIKKINPRAKKIILATTSSYIADLLARRYYQLTQEALENQLSFKINKINFEIKKEKKKSVPAGPLFASSSSSPSSTTPQSISAKRQYNPKTGLHPKFTFETFVVGNANNVAYAAAQGVIKNPGLAYNPFFIWGGVGVGKTHLLQAIGHEISKNHPGKKILYATSEDFTNELVSSLRERNTAQFKQKFRQPDVFLIDDIQFIAGKEYVQEEFFHTFNSLYIAEKQIVLTSDRKPEEIHPVEERLISRFMGGLTIDIQPPDFEMRVAILKQKARSKKVTLSEEVISFIAETIVSNTRELEGALSQLVARSQSNNQEINLLLVKEFFGIRSLQKEKKVSSRRILSVVGKTFKLKTSDLCGKSRKKELALARHIAAYLLRKELGLPLQKIGEILGGRDHTTIMHAESKIDRAFSTNQQIRHQIINIQKTIYQ